MKNRIGYSNINEIPDDFVYNQIVEKIDKDEFDKMYEHRLKIFEDIKFEDSEDIDKQLNNLIIRFKDIKYNYDLKNIEYIECEKKLYCITSVYDEAIQFQKDFTKSYNDMNKEYIEYYKESKKIQFSDKDMKEFSGKDMKEFFDKDKDMKEFSGKDKDKDDKDKDIEEKIKDINKLYILDTQDLQSKQQNIENEINNKTTLYNKLFKGSKILDYETKLNEYVKILKILKNHKDNFIHEVENINIVYDTYKSFLTRVSTKLHNYCLDTDTGTEKIKIIRHTHLKNIDEKIIDFNLIEKLILFLSNILINIKSELEKKFQEKNVFELKLNKYKNLFTLELI